MNSVQWGRCHSHKDSEGVRSATVKTLATTSENTWRWPRRQEKSECCLALWKDKEDDPGNRRPISSTAASDGILEQTAKLHPNWAGVISTVKQVPVYRSSTHASCYWANSRCGPAWHRPCHPLISAVWHPAVRNARPTPLVTTQW